MPRSEELASLKTDTRACFESKMLRPEPANEEPIELRRDSQVVLGISVVTESDKADLPWTCIGVSTTDPTEHIRGFVQPQHSSTRTPLLSDLSAEIPRSDEEPEPAGQALDEELPVLSHVNPKRGPTSGGNEIYLVVTNLSPTAVLHARFGPNIAATVGGLIGPGPLESDEYADNSFSVSCCARRAFLPSSCSGPTRSR